MIHSFSKIFIIWMFCGIPLQAIASESFVIEGALAQATSTTSSPADDPISPTGKIASLRFHIPIAQNKYKKLALTISNQIYDARSNGPLVDQVQLLYYTSLGAGLSYRYHYLLVGGEMHSASVRQSTIGTLTAVTNYGLLLPQVYAGFHHRLGAMGVALYYSYKKADLTSDKTGIPETRTYSESAVFFALTFHFDGSRKMFFRSLFTDDPPYP